MLIREFKSTHEKLSGWNHVDLLTFQVESIHKSSKIFVISGSV